MTEFDPLIGAWRFIGEVGDDWEIDFPITYVRQ